MIITILLIIIGGGLIMPLQLYYVRPDFRISIDTIVDEHFTGYGILLVAAGIGGLMILSAIYIMALGG